MFIATRTACGALLPANELHEVKARRLGAQYCVRATDGCILMSPLVFHHNCTVAGVAA